MKTYLWLIILFFGALGITLTGCDNDDDLLPTEVPSGVMVNFTAMFPGVTAQWERERGLLKAEFYNEGREVDVWFRPDGTWVMTSTDVFPSDLPIAVRDYASQNYPDRYIDDADWVETPSGSYYLLELDKHNAADVYVKVSAEGALVP